MKAVCTILFAVFTFSYLYWYQADILAVAQHALSGGMTHYNRTVGAILITLILLLIQAAIYYTTRLSRFVYALTFFPSLLILTVLTDVSPDIDQRFGFGGWLIAIPLLLGMFVGIIWLARQLRALEQEHIATGVFSRLVWVNVLLLSLQFVFVGMFSNTDNVFHYRMHMERCMEEGRLPEALATGRKSLATDSSLTMLRIYALSQAGQLGDRLFEYPIDGDSRVLMPNGRGVKMMMYPQAKFYRHLGVYVKGSLQPIGKLEFMQKHHLDTKASGDYLLCGYLLDRNIEGFVDNLARYYDLKAPLPKHYREALILNNHLHSSRRIVYRNDVMEADFQDYQELIRNSRNRQEKESSLRDTYGKTYWFYYQYNK